MRVLRAALLGALGGSTVRVGLSAAFRSGHDWAGWAWNHVDPLGDEIALKLTDAIQRTGRALPLGVPLFFEVAATLLFAIECALAAAVVCWVVRRLAVQNRR